jgi:hypothetical protein
MLPVRVTWISLAKTPALFAILSSFPPVYSFSMCFDDHRERVAAVQNPEALWKLARWAKSRGIPTSAFTPDIRTNTGTATEWKDKEKAFADTQSLAEQYHLLPRTHTGGRKATSCDHAIHLLTDEIHTAWRQGKVATLLMLDVSGAFDNVSHKRLMHNLRRRHIDPSIVGWVESYLTNRTTQIRLLEGTADSVPANTGIPQGSSLSPILYLFYNADLLEIGDPGDIVTGYVDDTSLLVTGDTKAENIAQLTKLHLRAADWARRTGSVFAPQKYEMIHITKRESEEADLPLHLPTAVVHPTESARYLRVILDKHMTGQKHVEHVEKRAYTAIGGIAAITGSTWGVSMLQALQLYKAVVLPIITFESSTWYKNYPAFGMVGHLKRQLSRLNAVQKKGLCVVTGAFRTTALAALEVETHTMPVAQQLHAAGVNTTLRIKGSPIYHHINASRRPGRLKAPSPLSILASN